MQLPTLDELTKITVNGLTSEEIKASYAFNHEILWYGMEAFAHAYVMQKARSVANGGIPLEDFLERYDLEFYHDLPIGSLCGGVLNLKKIESEGIFIPQQVYKDEKSKEISLFSTGDHINRILRKEWTDEKYARELLDRRWKDTDLEDLEMVELGVRFGMDMWKTCVFGFASSKGGFNFSGGPYDQPQSQKINELGEKLIEYYSSIIGYKNPCP